MKRNYKILLGGQVLSFLLAASGAAQATLHFECGLSAPTFTVGVIYVVLSFHLIVVFKRSRREYQYQQTSTTITTTFRDDDDGIWTIDDEDENDVYNIQEDQGSGTEVTEEPENTERGGGTVAQSHSAQSNHEQHTNSLLVPPSHSFFSLRIHRPVWQYFIIALLDCQANYFTVLAFRYTTLTSVTLFDSLAIPAAMLLSKFLLGRRYTRIHMFGVLSCMIGILFNVYQDYQEDIEDHSGNITTDTEESTYPHKLRGDILAILGGCLYGLNDVITETSVRATGDSTEYLGMVGLFAAMICMVQATILERQDILAFFNDSSTEESECSSGMAWGMFALFVGVSAAGYVGAAQFLQVSEAAFFNLSLLTGDMWSVLFSVIAEHIVPRPLFFVALVFVISGVIIYETAPSPVVEDRESTDHQGT